MLTTFMKNQHYQFCTDGRLSALERESNGHCQSTKDENQRTQTKRKGEKAIKFEARVAGIGIGWKREKLVV